MTEYHVVVEGTEIAVFYGTPGWAKRFAAYFPDSQIVRRPHVDGSNVSPSLPGEDLLSRP